MQWKDVIAKAPDRHRQDLCLRHPDDRAHQPGAATDRAGPDPGSRPGSWRIQIGDELRGLLYLHGGRPRGRDSTAAPSMERPAPGAAEQAADRGGHPGPADGPLQPPAPSGLDKIKTVILDEADRMLDMGFFNDVTRIIEKVKNRKNLGLFSATMSQEVMTVSAGCTSATRWRSPSPPTQENKPDIAQYYHQLLPLWKRRRSPSGCLTGSTALSGSSSSATRSICASGSADDLARAWASDAGCLHGDIRQKPAGKATMRRVPPRPSYRS